MRVSLKAATALFWLLSPTLAIAQTISPPEAQRAGRLGEELLRQQRQIEDERRAEIDRERNRPTPPAINNAPAAASAAPGGNCINVRELDLQGATRLSRADRRRLRESVVGRCLDARGIDDLLKAITELYVRRGLVTSRAYIPQQNSTDDRFTVVIIEGTVSRLEIEPKGSANAATAFPPLEGRIFNLRTAEQGLDQINRLPSNRAKIDIRPGEAPGSSVIAIVNQRSERLTGSFTLDNLGQDATGVWQAGMTLSYDNLLGLNDGLNGSIRQSVGEVEGDGLARAMSLGFSVPFRTLTITVLGSSSTYRSLVRGITRDFQTNGASDGITVRLDSVLYRDSRSKITGYAAINRRSVRNFIAGLRIDSSSRVLSTGDLSVNGSFVLGPSLLSVDLGVTRGLAFLGALKDDPTLPAGAPLAQYTRFNFGAGLVTRLNAGGIRAQFSNQLSGQISSDRLYASEQLSLTGPFAVRGYRNVSALADSGFILRNELAVPTGFTLPGTRQRGFVRAFVGYDVGRAASFDLLPARWVSGWAAGAVIGVSRINVQLSWSQAAARSAILPSDQQFFARLALVF